MDTDLRKPLLMAKPGAIWDPQIDDTLLCVDVHSETHDVKALRLSLTSESVFASRPGNL